MLQKSLGNILSASVWLDPFLLSFRDSRYTGIIQTGHTIMASVWNLELNSLWHIVGIIVPVYTLWIEIKDIKQNIEELWIEEWIIFAQSPCPPIRRYRKLRPLITPTMSSTYTRHRQLFAVGTKTRKTTLATGGVVLLPGSSHTSVSTNSSTEVRPGYQTCWVDWKLNCKFLVFFWVVLWTYVIRFT